MSNIENPALLSFGRRWLVPSILLRGLTSITLWTLLLVMYLLSGVLTFASGYTYRMGLTSFLVLPLLLLRGLRIDRVFVGFFLLIVVVLLSGLVNDSSLGQIGAFLRIPLFAYLMYYVTSVAVNDRNMRRVMTFLLVVAVVQLPVMLLQWWAYDKVPAAWKVGVVLEDYGFGTFNFKTDYSLSFLLTLLSAWLLLDRRRSMWVRFRIPLAIWYSLTVVIAAAQIMKIGVMLVWLVYLLTQLRLRTILAAAAAAAVFYIGANMLYDAGYLAENPVQFIDRFRAETSVTNSDGYLLGKYDRWGGLKYLLSGNVSLLGDGPSAFTDALTRSSSRGNNGHFFVFFAEIGPVGWIASVLVYAAIALPILGGRLRIGLVPVVCFVVLNMLSFTSSVMNDIAVVSSFCLVMRASTMPALERAV